MRASGSPTKRGTLALLAACAFFLHAGLARAAPFDLEWSAPEGCPTRERIIAASRHALGEEESHAPPELFVHGTVVPEGGALTLHLRVTDAAGADLGERRVHFNDRRCEALEEPTALLVAMMIAVARSTEPSNAGDNAPSSTIAPAASPPVERPAPTTPAAPATPIAPSRDHATPSPRASERSHTRTPMTISASTVTSLGFLPNVGLGAAVRWTASFSRVVVGVEGSFETTWATKAASGEATFRYFDLGALAGIRVLRTHAVELTPLLQAHGGVLAGSASGFQATFDTPRIVGIVAAGVLTTIPLGSASHLELLPDVRTPLVHDEFAVRENGKLIRVHSIAPVETRLTIGVGWAF